MADITQAQIVKAFAAGIRVIERVRQYYKFPAWRTCCIRKHVLAAFAYIHVHVVKVRGFQSHTAAMHALFDAYMLCLGPPLPECLCTSKFWTQCFLRGP